MTSRAPTRRQRARNLLDVLVLAWSIVWLITGWRVATEVRDLGDIGTTVGRVGAAIEETGVAIEALRSVPLLGGQIADAGPPIREAGVAARQSAAQSRESADELSVLLGFSIGLVPTLPLLLVYVPARVARERERRAVARAMAGADAAELQQLLAWRAVTNLPFDRLREISAHPYDDLRCGRYDALARAELDRIGLSADRRPRERSAT